MPLTNAVLDQCCPCTTAHHRDPHNPWFTQWMWDLRAGVERLFQLKCRNPTPTIISLFTSTQSRYRRECKRRRRRSWHNHIAWTPGPKAASESSIARRPRASPPSLSQMVHSLARVQTRPICSSRPTSHSLLPPIYPITTTLPSSPLPSWNISRTLSTLT